MKFESWSFSSYSNWAKCPFYAMHKHLLKTPEPPSPALVNGRRVHSIAENYVKKLKYGPAEIPVVLCGLASSFALVQDVKVVEVLTESKMAFDKLWKYVYWCRDNVWLRVVVDLLIRTADRTLVVDYKTGKEYPDVYQQLDLYAVCAEKFDKRAITCEAWYVNTGKIITIEKTRKQCRESRREWKERVAPMLAATEFPATENFTCKWCYLNKEKEGLCPIR
jgi:hypothetical protein